MTHRSVLVRVPATVGSFGGATNCAALALNAVLNVKVTTRQDGGVGVRYFGENGQRVPRDRSNLVVRALEAALQQKGLAFTGADFEIYSSVPVGVGLGSSTAAVLAGLIAADRLFHLHLEEEQLFQLAASYEVRSDNLRAAWQGGFVTRTEEKSKTHYWTIVPEDLVLRVVVPLAALSPAGTGAATVTESAHLARARAFSEFMAQPWHRAAPDLAVELPRSGVRVVPGLEEALKVRTAGLLSLFLCGSGPSVGILAPDEASSAAVKEIGDLFARHNVSWAMAEFRPTNTGAREWNSAAVSTVVSLALDLEAPLHKSVPLRHARNIQLASPAR